MDPYINSLVISEQHLHGLLDSLVWFEILTICDSQNFGIPGLAVLELPSLLRDTGDSQSDLPDNIQIFCFNKSR